MGIRRLYICNNPYQIIVSLLIAKKLHNSNDFEDIMITDNFLHSKKIYINIKETSFFNKTFFVNINAILFPKTIKNRCQKIARVIKTDSFLKNIEGDKFDHLSYDEIFYNNDDLFLYNLVLCCFRNNSKIKIFRFEEGYSSYLTPFCSPRAQKIFNLKNKHSTFIELLCGMYFFYPDKPLFKTKVELKKINGSVDSDFKHMIKTIFQIPNLKYDLDGKWIIFEESFYQDYGYNADIEFYKEIIENLGAKNIVVKLHPRSKTNRFCNMGVQIMINDGIPWEAIVLSNDFKNIKLLTLASGSVINSRLMLGDCTESYLLYKCIKPSVPTLDDRFEKFVTEFKDLFGKGVRIPNDMCEFYATLYS